MFKDARGLQVTRRCPRLTPEARARKAAEKEAKAKRQKSPKPTKRPKAPKPTKKPKAPKATKKPKTPRATKKPRAATTRQPDAGGSPAPGEEEEELGRVTREYHRGRAEETDYQ